MTSRAVRSAATTLHGVAAHTPLLSSSANDDEESAPADGPVTQALQSGDAGLGTADHLTSEKEPADNAEDQGQQPAGLSLADVLA
ncbi:hypothetical protein ACFU8Q_16240, partial [Streptomyces sp. NPDC057543]|uniref:hypothetical protein n=1 Tax=Streptomyces sp. NPDC057543 TaxID=3346163 RepID=UPI0036AAA1F5